MIERPERQIARHRRRGRRQHHDPRRGDARTCTTRSARSARPAAPRASRSARPRPQHVLDELAADALDLALCMSVNPGWGGQQFIPASLDKLARMRAALPDHVTLEVDGGVHDATARSVAEAGANWLVTGSAVFGSRGSGGRIREIVAASGASGSGRHQDRVRTPARVSPHAPPSARTPRSPCWRSRRWSSACGALAAGAAGRPRRRQRRRLRQGDLHGGRPVREGRGGAQQRAQLRQADQPAQGKKAVQGFLTARSPPTPTRRSPSCRRPVRPTSTNGKKISTTIVAAFKDSSGDRRRPARRPRTCRPPARRRSRTAPTSSAARSSRR